MDRLMVSDDGIRWINEMDRDRDENRLREIRRKELEEERKREEEERRVQFELYNGKKETKRTRRHGISRPNSGNGDSSRQRHGDQGNSVTTLSALGDMQDTQHGGNIRKQSTDRYRQEFPSLNLPDIMKLPPQQLPPADHTVPTIPNMPILTKKISQSQNTSKRTGQINVQSGIVDPRKILKESVKELKGRENQYLQRRAALVERRINNDNRREAILTKILSTTKDTPTPETLLTQRTLIQSLPPKQLSEDCMHELIDLQHLRGISSLNSMYDEEYTKYTVQRHEIFINLLDRHTHPGQCITRADNINTLFNTIIPQGRNGQVRRFVGNNMKGLNRVKTVKIMDGIGHVREGSRDNSIGSKSLTNPNTLPTRQPSKSLNSLRMNKPENSVSAVSSEFSHRSIIYKPDPAQ